MNRHAIIHLPAGQPHPMRGFSLIELMVSMVIGVIILLGVVQIFGASRSNYQVNDGMARLQENARFAADFLEREIRMAGFAGCTKNVDNFYNAITGISGASAISGQYNMTIAVDGHEANSSAPGNTYTMANSNPDPAPVAATQWSPALPADLTGRVLPGTDVVIIRRMSDDNIRLVPPFNDSAQIFTEVNSIIQSNDVLVVADCSKAAMFQATTVSGGAAAGKLNVAHGNGGTPGNACANWVSGGGAGCPANPISFEDGAMIARYSINAFYLGRNTAGNVALFTTSLNTTAGTLTPVELVEGVESMQILYGVDMGAANTPLSMANIQYFTASGVAARAAGQQWERVVSVRFSLLMRTVNTRLQGNVEEAADVSQVDSATYNVAGTTINPFDDFHRRRVFNATVMLRNKGS